jgi:hypothetical protein
MIDSDSSENFGAHKDGHPPERRLVDELVREIFMEKKDGVQRPLLEWMVERYYLGQSRFSSRDIIGFYFRRESEGEAALADRKSWDAGRQYYDDSKRQAHRPFPLVLNKTSFEAGREAAKAADTPWSNHRGKRTLLKLQETLKAFNFENSVLSKQSGIRIHLSRFDLRIGGLKASSVAAAVKNQEGAEPNAQAKLRVWTKDTLESILDEIKHTEPTQDCDDDLRISTSAFPPEMYPDDKLQKLLKHRHLRIKIILTNPKRRDLIWSRNEARTDQESPERALGSIKYQYERLSNPESFPPSTKGGGRFAVKVSNLMPLGFYILTKDKAFIGWLWSNTSFSAGPLLEVDCSSPLWRSLQTDWKTRWEYDDEKMKNEFDEFFGREAWSTDPDSPTGTVILQSDLINDLQFPTVDGSSATEEELVGTDRVFKARRWVNRCDTDGVQGLLQLFHKNQINLPTVLFSDHSYADLLSMKNAPFEIILGGFTSKTRTQLNQIGAGWMRFDIRTNTGDTLVLRKDLLKTKSLIGLPDADQNFVHVVPGDWNPSYMERWSQKIRKPNDYPAQDYGMILRHTTRKKTQFFLSGFTEVGTAAAAYYLANHWNELRKEFVVPGKKKRTEGDFLLLIEGESEINAAVTDLWEITEAIRLPLDASQPGG